MSTQLSPFNIMDMTQQMRQIHLAQESILSLLGEDTQSLPVWIDEEYLYWCTSMNIGPTQVYNIVVTKYDVEAAGELVRMTAMISHSPVIRKTVLDAINNALKMCDEDIIELRIKEAFGDFIRMPDGAYKWLERAKSVL